MHVEDYARMNIAAVAEDRLPDDLFWKLRTSHRFEINLSNRDAWPVAARDEVARIGVGEFRGGEGGVTARAPGGVPGRPRS